MSIRRSYEFRRGGRSAREWGAAADAPHARARGCTLVRSNFPLLQGGPILDAFGRNRWGRRCDATLLHDAQPVEGGIALNDFPVAHAPEHRCRPDGVLPSRRDATPLAKMSPLDLAM